MNQELLQEAQDLIIRMSDEKAAFFLRILDAGDELVQAFLDSGITQISEANRFVNEWEAQHERA